MTTNSRYEVPLQDGLANRKSLLFLIRMNHLRWSEYLIRKSLVEPLVKPTGSPSRTKLQEDPGPTGPGLDRPFQPVPIRKLINSEKREAKIPKSNRCFYMK